MTDDDPAIPAILRHGDRPLIIAFAMPLDGHFAALRPVLRDLAESGSEVLLMSHARFADETTSLGVQFYDLFGAFPLEQVDPAAGAKTLRYGSFAAHYIDEILPLVRELAPQLIIYESYALIGQVVGRLLGLPYVAVLTQHEFGPDVATAFYGKDHRFRPTAETRRAVARLHELGLTDLTHLSFANSLSPYLNVYPEPPEFLSAAAAPSFEPVRFYGSLVGRPEPTPARAWFRPGAHTRVYASIGSYAFEAFTEDCIAALTRLVDGLAAAGEVEAIVSLGSLSATAETIAALTRPNVRVEAWVDQSAVLAEADVFITHHGLSSTHEAIDQLVPMLSFPIFGDQFGQAELCQALGVALPLGALQSLPSDHEVAAAIASVCERRADLRERLAVARGWEDAVIAQRPEVIARIRELGGAAER